MPAPVTPPAGPPTPVPDVQPTPAVGPPPTPKTAPDTRALPEHMLVEGDLVFHQGHGWFHRVTQDATCPSSAQSGADGNGNFLVALDINAARAWNRAKREERMA